MATTKPDNTDNPPIMACEFEISGKFPKEAFEMFADAQAKLLGLRGYIKEVSADLYKGVLEGEGKVIEAFKQLIATAAEYVAAVKEFIIKNMKAIEKYSYENFEVRN